MAGSHRSGIRPCPYASMFKPCAIHLATISTSRECLIIPARRCSINVTPVKRPCILSFKSYAPVPQTLRKQTLGLRECDWTLSHIWCLIIRDIELSTTDYLSPSFATFDFALVHLRDGSSRRCCCESCMDRPSQVLLFSWWLPNRVDRQCQYDPSDIKIHQPCTGLSNSAPAGLQDAMRTTSSSSATPLL